MPYHYKPKNSNKPPTTVKANIINKSNLHHTQKARMLKHSHHHTKKHLEFMIRKMNQGHTFAQSHMSAMNKVGK